MAVDTAGARRVLVTGAAGFVGRVLVSELAARGWQVTAAVRSLPPAPDRVRGADYLPVGDLLKWCQAPQDLQGFTHVVHTAARVHVMHGGNETALMRGNAEVTARLAERAATFDRAYIGSCTGGKTEDFLAAATILNGRRVRVDTFLVPATTEASREST
mgnify:CR=1 FL=1